FPVDEGLPLASGDLDRDLPLRTPEGEPAGDRRLLRAEPHQLRQPAGAQRAQRAEEVQRFEQAGLSLPIAPHNHRGVRRWPDGDAVQIPDLRALESLEEPSPRIGMTTAV